MQIAQYGDTLNFRIVGFSKNIGLKNRIIDNMSYLNSSNHIKFPMINHLCQNENRGATGRRYS